MEQPDCNIVSVSETTACSKNFFEVKLQIFGNFYNVKLKSKKGLALT